MKQCISIIFTIMFCLSIATGMSYAEEITVLEFEGSASNTSETSLDISYENIEYIRVTFSDLTDSTEAYIKFFSKTGTELIVFGIGYEAMGGAPFPVRYDKTAFNPDDFPLTAEGSIFGTGTLGGKIVVTGVYN